MVKAAFFDIDGTFLSSKGTILPSTLKAIELLHQSGIVCGIASGRGPQSIQSLIGHTPMDCYVLYNGQLAFSHDTGIYENYFSIETLERLARFGDKEDRQMIFGSRHAFYGSSSMKIGQRKMIKKIYHLLPDTWSKKELTHLIKKWATFPLASSPFMSLPLFSEPVYQCVLLSPEREQARLEQEFPDCTFTRSNSYSVDIVPAGGSKLIGIEQVLSHYNLSLTDVIAFGDSWNDLDMLKGVGISVAMGNGEKEVKEVADFITTGNDEDGIYQALKTLKIIR